MKAYYGYTRVSTAKQGLHGVSLIEQKAAIERYAEKNDLTISEWFEERETAAKRGRAVFSRMLSLLRGGRAQGVVMHKIDRSARNLKDWADLGELIDAGVEVHFAADSLDLNSRGGRLSADIQAVVAADYIRNLREESRKGFYGRLKQGLYPLPAPLGYIDHGGGKAKTPDPLTAPFVRLAFELYGTGRYSLDSLCRELTARGARSKTGATLRASSLSLLLNNSFYAGIVRLKKSGETFRGVHEPLISVSAYERVQRVLKGKLVYREVRHDFLYRRLFKCGLCGAALVGERQKGHVYYRCHTRGCVTPSAREERLEQHLRQLFQSIQLSEAEVSEAKGYLERQADDTSADHEKAALALAQGNLQARLNRLTDAFVDGLISKEVFEGRRAALVTEQADVAQRQLRAEDLVAAKRAAIAQTLELAENLIRGYEIALPAEKRQIIELISSNRTFSGNELAIKLQNPFLQLQKCLTFQSGGPYRGAPRTANRIRTKQIERFIDRMMSAETPIARTA